jgi:hypothetical protein
MNIHKKTTTGDAGKLANTNRQTAIKESKMKITTPKLIRWAGLPAMAAGIIFIVIQPIHPPDILSSVTTSTWAVVQSLKFTMAILGLFGIAGIYARQVEESGWLGLAGYLMLSLFYALTVAFSFTEAFITPLLATEAPQFVENVLGLAFGNFGANLGAISGLYLLAVPLFLLGGLLFGIATLRAGVLPRWAAILLAFGAASPPVLSLLIPHPQDRILAVPIGLALIWLGYALWSERRAPVSEPMPGIERPQLSQSGAD